MKKAIILDRDGTLIEDKGYEYKTEHMRIYPGVVEGLGLLKEDYLLFIITNQPGIGKGYYGEQDFHRFNDHLAGKLCAEGIRIERTYYCPHKAEDNCGCRKPSLRHMRSIESEFKISLSESWVVGDHPSDVLMGADAGCRTAYVLTGHGEKHYGELEEKKIRPTIVAPDFLGAAKGIISWKKR